MRAAARHVAAHKIARSAKIMTSTATPKAAPSRHTIGEDALGLFTGVILAGLSMHLLGAAGLVTGQTAGAALLIAQVGGYDLGLVFFLINLPFYGFALMRMGWVFTMRTFIAVVALSAFTSFAPRLLPMETPDPVAAAIAGAVLAGVGLIVLFRHRASLGGVGILGLYLQDKTGFRAGWSQLIIDAAIFGVAFLLLDTQLALISALGALILNVIVALNHRADRYIAR